MSIFKQVFNEERSKFNQEQFEIQQENKEKLRKVKHKADEFHAFCKYLSKYVESPVINKIYDNPLELRLEFSFKCAGHDILVDATSRIAISSAFVYPSLVISGNYKCDLNFGNYYELEVDLANLVELHTRKAA